MEKDFENEEEEITESMEEDSSTESMEEDSSIVAPRTEKTKGAITPKDIYIVLTVEVGRLRMTAQHLMELRAGNLLDLDIVIENGVDLAINGKRVGKGELIRVGNKLGVKILEVG